MNFTQDQWNSFKLAISDQYPFALFHQLDDSFLCICLNQSEYLFLTNQEHKLQIEAEWSDLSLLIHPDDLDLFSIKYLASRHESVISFNFRIKRSNKSEILKIELYRLNDLGWDSYLCFNAKIFDVRKLQTPETIKLALRSNFDAMLENSDDFIFFKDLHHVYTASSLTMANITGFKHGREHIGLTDYDIFPEEHADEYYKLEKELYLGKRSKVEENQQYFDVDGQPGWVNNRKYPIYDAQGQMMGLFGIARVVTEIIRTKKELEIAKDHLITLANFDSLTGIHNRRHGYELSCNTLELAKQNHWDFTMIIFDIDYFKKVNDQFGHACGDRVLTHIAHVVKSILREEDVFYRYGGEEFVICLHKMNLSTAQHVVERIRNKLAQSPLEGMDTSITISGGVVFATSEILMEELIKQADLLLYQAKANGRNQFIYASAGH